MSKDYIYKYFDNVPYHKRLGVKLKEICKDTLKLDLPFIEKNSDFGDVLHGGIDASLISITAKYLILSSLDTELDNYQISIIQQDVQYLSAAVSEPVTAVGTILKQGKELAFVSIDILKKNSVFVARGIVTLRYSRKPAPEYEIYPENINWETFYKKPYMLSPMAEIASGQGFIKDVGMNYLHMDNRTSIIKLDFRNELSTDGKNFHEGIITALSDTAGAMAAWASISIGLHKASTPAIQMNFFDLSKGDNIIALGKVLSKKAESFISEVSVVCENSHTIIAKSVVVYRIVI